MNASFASRVKNLEKKRGKYISECVEFVVESNMETLRDDAKKKYVSDRAYEVLRIFLSGEDFALAAGEADALASAAFVHSRYLRSDIPFPEICRLGLEALFSGISSFSEPFSEPNGRIAFRAALGALLDLSGRVSETCADTENAAGCPSILFLGRFFSFCVRHGEWDALKTFREHFSKFASNGFEKDIFSSLWDECDTANNDDHELFAAAFALLLFCVPDGPYDGGISYIRGQRFGTEKDAFVWEQKYVSVMILAADARFRFLSPEARENGKFGCANAGFVPTLVEFGVVSVDEAFEFLFKRDEEGETCAEKLPRNPPEFRKLFHVLKNDVETNPGRIGRHIDFLGRVLALPKVRNEAKRRGENLWLDYGKYLAVEAAGREEAPETDDGVPPL